jgi:guanylate kinase
VKRRRDRAEIGMKEKGRGLVFIISAPSGAGKTTLLKKIIMELPGLQFSVSYTTRLPRAGEREGEDYHFISSTVFQKMVERDEFLEWAEVLGNRYGTAREVLKALGTEGVDLILDIDTQGARKVTNKVSHTILIYILPPSLKALDERLVKRSLDSPEMIQFRLANAKRDMEEARWYHYVIVNEKLEDTAEKVKAIIIAERCKKEKDFVLEENMKQWEDPNGKNYSRRLSEESGE